MSNQHPEAIQPESRQRGASVIEAFVVLGLAGVIASLLVPAWQSFAARDQIGEAVAMLSEAKPAVEAYYFDSGERFPQAGAAALRALGVRTHGVYVERIVSDGMGGLVARFRDGEVSEALAGATLVFELRRSPMRWVCSTGGQSPIPERLLPPGCRRG